jgi:hypothetical protein
MHDAISVVSQVIFHETVGIMKVRGAIEWLQVLATEHHLHASIDIHQVLHDQKVDQGRVVVDVQGIDAHVNVKDLQIETGQQEGETAEILTEMRSTM